MDFTAITIGILKALSHIAGGYGFAIILLTVIVRLSLWPFAVSQQKSMKKMQELSPKLKLIQDRYKSEPQVLQKKMAEFYKEHSFNPFSGCFTMLIQLPVFFILYGALASPQFNEIAGKSSFLFINQLNAPIQSHAGKVGDGIFGVNPNDKFITEKTIKVTTKDGKTSTIDLKNPNKAVEVQGKIVAGYPMDLKINLPESTELSFDQINPIKSAVVPVVNNATKEIEKLTFEKKGDLLVSTVKTEKVKTKIHFDVLILALLFGGSMLISQKFMSKSMKNDNMDPAQKAMQDQMSKLLPVMFIPMFLFVPIPAGVFLYMIVSNVIQIGQTVIINKMLESEQSVSEAKVTVVE
ncbi:MAG: YidC/Oxa1 family membrane protein insertase [bacterium]